MRRRGSPAPAGPHALRSSGDRWLFGYADMVTLLFACFATLYAARMSPVAAATSGPDALPASGSTPMAAADLNDASTRVTAAGVTSEELDDLEDDLATLLRTAGALPGLEIGSSTRGVVISLPEAGSFAPGRTELSASAREALLGVAALMRDRAHHVRVEGHTDDVPITGGRFASNWELSTARATTVVQLLIEHGHLAPTRLAAAGYADHRPRVANTTADLRARNRRVDIVVLDSDAAALEGPLPTTR